MKYVTIYIQKVYCLYIKCGQLVWGGGGGSTLYIEAMNWTAEISCQSVINAR